jgi:hypothetical protein
MAVPEVSADVDAFPSVLCPVTESVPLETSEEVAVTEPPVTLPLVSEEKKPVTPCTMLAMRPVVVVVAVIFALVAFAWMRLLVPLTVIELALAFPRFVWPEMVRSVAVVVARVDVPVTERVPFEVRVEVAVIFPIVALEEKIDEKKPVVALSIVAKNPVVVVVAETLRLVAEAFTRFVCPVRVREFAFKAPVFV